jgi:crossover junction endodeoxyribonuclease RuvC
LILGVDPGSHHTGFGIIETDGRTHRLVDAGVISPPSRSDLPERLHHVHDALSALLHHHRPTATAVEDVFHAANVRSALVLGHARGVVLLACAQAGVRVLAYPPATIKLSATGTGQATKSQVAFMVARHLGIAERPAGDATDALAAALCAALHESAHPLIAHAGRR